MGVGMGHPIRLADRDQLVWNLALAASVPTRIYTGRAAPTICKSLWIINTTSGAITITLDLCNGIVPDVNVTRLLDEQTVAANSVQRFNDEMLFIVEPGEILYATPSVAGVVVRAYGELNA